VITREPEILTTPVGFFGRIGRWTFTSCREIGRASLLLLRGLFGMRLVLKRRMRRETVSAMYVYGIRSLGVITIVALFTGMVLALNTGIALRDFNQEANVGTAVMVSMLREMGPFMTGLILAACVGSAMAAQLGTMTVSEEIAALEIMSIDPVRYLVVPRLTAMTIMTPLLAFYTCMMGVVGGGIVANALLSVSWLHYIDNAFRFARAKDLYVGLLKAMLFGMIITIVSCHEGFSASRGAVGVGLATRKAVIVSFLMILFVGLLITGLFYY
jgi:phospholipid/cholesterol/gamma-HCH transport system permease protein